MIARDDVARAVIPLKVIFWGWVLQLVAYVIPYIDTSHRVPRLPSITDAVGSVLLLIGVLMLGFIRGNRKYSWVMAIAIILSLVRGVWPLVDTVAFWAADDFWEGLGLYIRLTFWVELIFLPTMVLLSLSMAWLSDSASLPRVAASWRTTRNLFLCLNAIPLGLCFIILLFGLFPKLYEVRVFHTTWFAIVAKVVTNLPLIYFYDSTSRMPR